MSGTRKSLPCVAVEIAPRRTMRPRQLGGGQWIDQDVLFHVLAENASDRDQLIDLITYQNDKGIYIVNRNSEKSSSKYPANLDFNGSPTVNSIMYPEMVAASGDQLVLAKPKGGFRSNIGVYMQNMTVQQMGQINPYLHGAIVRTTFTVGGEI